MLGKKGLVKTPNEADKYAGVQLRKLRKINKLSQRELGEKLGITFQQIQKYEKGLNRIGIGRLYELCRALGSKPSYFFVEEDFINSKSLDLKVAENYGDNSMITDLLLSFKSLNTEKQRQVLDFIATLL